jgi:hypothetical protein
MALIGILSVLYLACPFGLTLTANLDGRFVPLTVGFFAALVRWQKPKESWRQLLWLGAFLSVSLFGSITIGKLTLKGNSEAQKVRSYAQRMNRGDLLIPMDINIIDSQDRGKWDPGLRMLPYFAMCEKQLVMPGIFMFPSQQPVTVKPGNPILDFVNTEEPGQSDQDQLSNGISKVQKLLGESRSFSKTPVYLLIVNHARTGIPKHPDLEILDQDQNIAWAKLNSHP